MLDNRNLAIGDVEVTVCMMEKLLFYGSWRTVGWTATDHFGSPLSWHNQGGEMSKQVCLLRIPPYYFSIQWNQLRYQRYLIIKNQQTNWQTSKLNEFSRLTFFWMRNIFNCALYYISFLIWKFIQLIYWNTNQKWTSLVSFRELIELGSIIIWNH